MLPQRNHLTCGVGIRDSGVADPAGDRVLDGREIAVVDGRCAHPHPHLARPGFGGVAFGEAEGIVFVNDSKATNADAAEKALLAYDNIRWIAGGQPKEGGIEPLRPLFGKIAKAYLIGEAEAAFAETLGEVAHMRCGTLAEAVGAARADARSGDVILLSPACASFDQFASFEARGEAFRELVAPSLPEEAGR